MEKKIKALYILSIAAILAFLGMQAYWLYGRYEYSLREYEDKAEIGITEALRQYDKARSATSATVGERIQSTYNMNHNVDSAGNSTRHVTISTKIIQGHKLLGIKEDRKLTPEEMDELEKMVMDSIEGVETKRATLDVTSAPSDGAAWSAMKNFELEVQSPFTAEGIDSVLRKEDIHADISLIVTDTLTWAPVLKRHSSVFSPRFRITAHYSELEHKAVVVDCRIPAADVLREMGLTLVVALVLSLFLILCLIWQVKTIAKLNRIDRMRNSFITTMIHELKRPISTLKMCVSGFDNSKLMADAQLRHELTGETRMALDCLSAYFSKLRDITFNNVEQIPLNVTAFKLKELVDGVIRTLAIPSGKQADVKADVADDVLISADRAHLANILTNLLENAIKYSGEEVEVKVSADWGAEGVTITVADNGHGISLADRGRIFNRFYRGKAASRDIPGMGLGLSYVKLLVDAHGGAIKVESAEGEGSKFIIIFPQ